MTDKEILDALGRDTPLNNARKVFAAQSALIEQAHQQRRRPSVFDLRRMEFQAVKEIAAALGVVL